MSICDKEQFPTYESNPQPVVRSDPPPIIRLDAVPALHPMINHHQQAYYLDSHTQSSPYTVDQCHNQIPKLNLIPSSLPICQTRPSPRRANKPISETFDDSGDYSESDSFGDECSPRGGLISPSNPLDPFPKLAISKSPVMEALVYCALQGWGIHLVKNVGSEIIFRVDDFEFYCKKSYQICSKQNPTNDKLARIKALKRWFPDFPNRRELPQPTEFLLSVARDKDKLSKIRKMIEKNKRLLEPRKVRRMA